MNDKLVAELVGALKDIKIEALTILSYPSERESTKNMLMKLRFICQIADQALAKVKDEVKGE